MWVLKKIFFVEVSTMGYCRAIITVLQYYSMKNRFVAIVI
jgi:hypothetical protein